MDESVCFLRDEPLQAQSTCHCGFKEQNRYEAWFSLNLHTNGKMANEISELRASRELTEHLTWRFPNTGLQLGPEQCKVFTSLQ